MARIEVQVSFYTLVVTDSAGRPVRVRVYIDSDHACNAIEDFNIASIGQVSGTFTLTVYGPHDLCDNLLNAPVVVRRTWPE
jgi:hypothetical protein